MQIETSPVLVKPSFLSNDSLELLFIGGKGGSGKTTSAAAAALFHRDRGRKVLIISIDPAHSLGDALGIPLSSEIQEVKEAEGLFAAELDADKVLERFKTRYEMHIETALERGTFLEKSDISKLFSLSLPGLDEIAALMEIASLIKKKAYDLIIVDTAPTGHTVIFLNLPAKLTQWINVIELMQSKHRYLVKQFTGRYKKNGVDHFINEIKENIQYITRLFADGEKCEFVPVMVPEPLSMKETETLLEELQRLKIHVKTIIINHVQNGQDCPFCSSRSSSQEQYLIPLETSLSDYDIVRIPAFPYEIHGIPLLLQFSAAMNGEKVNGKHTISSSVTDVHEISVTESGRKWVFPPEGVKYIFFGGKGGVGKTVLAASTAVFLESLRGKKVLVVSTDPAHSLKDVFEIDQAGEEKIRITETLSILEINAPKIFLEFKDECRESLDKTFSSFVSNGMDVAFDRAIIKELLNFSPPGIDEIMALMKLVDLLEEQYEICIIDTSATGHLLRFLELPGIIAQWNNAFLTILLKYKAGSNLIKEKLLQFTKKTKMIEHMLKNVNDTRFVVVSIAELLGIAETERFLASLAALSIPCKDIVFNMLVPPSTCTFHQAKRDEQKRQLKPFYERYGNSYQILEVPLFTSSIHGTAGLKELAESLFQ
ncbi:MAG: ArsA family ATPase [Vulcanimicrobiota bacterium]